MQHYSCSTFSAPSRCALITGTVSYTHLDVYKRQVWTSTGNEATYVDGLCGEYTSNQLLGFYPCINNCNRAILSIREGKVDGKFASDQAYAEQRMAEAMFNRSYCIYLMNTLLGDVYVPRGYTTALRCV